MEARVLDEMRTCKGKIEDEALQARSVSRAYKLRAEGGSLADSSFLQSYLTDGTDEEFNTCAKEVNYGLHWPTSQFFEGLVVRISTLLPSIQRPGTVQLAAVTPVEKASEHREDLVGPDAPQEHTQ